MNKQIIFILMSSLMLGCSINLGSFKELRTVAPKEMQEIQKRKVTGEHCRFFNLFTGFSFPQIDLAVLDAMSKAPGAKGLKNVNVSEFRSPFFNYFCYEVEGIPVK